MVHKPRGRAVFKPLYHSSADRPIQRHTAFVQNAFDVLEACGCQSHRLFVAFKIELRIRHYSQVVIAIQKQPAWFQAAVYLAEKRWRPVAVTGLVDRLERDDRVERQKSVKPIR